MRSAWRNLRFAPAATWAGVIWFASSFDWRHVHLPGDSQAGAGFGQMLRALAAALPAWIEADKAVHTMLFALLTLLLRWPSRVRSALLAAALAWTLGTAWGLVDELHQAFVPGRSTDALDLLADAIGAAIAVSLFEVVRRGHGRLGRPGGRGRAITAAPAS